MRRAYGKEKKKFHSGPMSKVIWRNADLQTSDAAGAIWGKIYLSHFFRQRRAMSRTATKFGINALPRREDDGLWVPPRSLVPGIRDIVRVIIMTRGLPNGLQSWDFLKSLGMKDFGYISSIFNLA